MVTLPLHVVSIIFSCVIFAVSADLSLFVFQHFYQFLYTATCRLCYPPNIALINLFINFRPCLHRCLYSVQCAQTYYIFLRIASVRNFPYSLQLALIYSIKAVIRFILV
jgi:hypothetical protein